jgi:pimeloyl-ACP methyl ester carboxylesterase
VTVQQLNIANSLDRLEWAWQGHRIEYTAVGSGTPVVLVHGFGASIGHWCKNIPALAAGGYRVYALDLLGFGNSDKPAIDYSLELWQALLKDFWAAHIQEPTVFIGNSIGALICLMLATNYPEMTLGAVLLNSAGGLSHRPDELAPFLRFVMATFTKLISSKVTGKFLFNQIRQRHRIRRTLHQVYRDRASITDELVEMLYQPSCHPNAHQVFASVVTAPAGPEPDDLLPDLQRPLLVIWGAADPWTPIGGANIYKEFGATMEIEFHAIPNTGHCPHDERPEIVNAKVLEWLEKIGDRAI